MKTRYFACLTTVTFLGVGAVWSCGGHPFNNADGGDASTDANVTFGEGGEGGCARTCSSDFHSVVDCTGATVQACTGTDGCDPSIGNCANACQAAIGNKSAVGCDYYATDMDEVFGGDFCYVAFVANTWDTDAHISVEYDGATLSNVNSFTAIPTGKDKNITYTPFTGALPAGQVAMLFLGGKQGAAPSCPIATAEGSSAQLYGTGIGHSFHVTTDVPVVMYQINPYGTGNTAKATGSSLLLPVSAWDTNYIGSAAAPGGGFTIVAAQNNTVVSLLPKVDLVGGNGIPTGKANTTVNFTLNKGEFAQIEQSGDLTSSVISSTLPIGVMSGHTCMAVPQGVSYCDHGEQMLPAVKALGHEYVGVMYRPREGEPAIWRLVGAVDGTTLTWTPSAPGAMDAYPAAPIALNQGDMKEFATGTPFVVQSQDDQHPFMLFEYMSGSEWTGMNFPTNTVNGIGDPDFSVQVPPQQYPSHYVIMTDPTYPETNLVLIRRQDGNNQFQDVTIDCLTSPITGWQPIGNYEWTRLDLQTGNFNDVNGCSNGHHELTSKAPFGLNVWGWGTLATGTDSISYSYPGGMNVVPINKVIIPPTPH